MENSTLNSIVFGCNSDKPTLIIGSSPGLGYTGRIGIGDITNPTAKLHIKADASEDADILLMPGTSKYARIKFGETFPNSSPNRIEAQAASDLKFYTASDFVFLNGNVGINIANPSEKLDVNGTIKSNGFKLTDGNQATGMVLQSDANGLASWVDPMTLNVDDGDWTIAISDIYRLTGNVGIGTTSPNQKLDVVGTIKSTGLILMDGNQANGRILQSDADGNASWVDNDWTTSSSNIYRQYGNVGIGLTSPQCRFHIKDNLSNLDGEFFKVSNDNVLGGGTTIIGKQAGNGPVFVQQGGSVNFGQSGPHLAIKQKANNGDVGLDISTFTDQNGDIAWSNIEAPNSSFYLISSNDLIFRTGPGLNQVYFTESGDVGIGVPVPQARLDVDGKILCGEVEIISLGKWKDYVFEDNYNLRPLQDVEDFIFKNGHLPDLPSESEVLENGYNIGEMDALLLQKIEELTLYVIDLKKEIQELKGE